MLLISACHGSQSVGHVHVNADGSLTNDEGLLINQGASSSFQPWNTMALGQGWTVEIEDQSDITQWVPVGTSAVHLENFWQSTFEQCSQRFWSNARQSRRHSLESGALHFLIEPMSTSTMQIPWIVMTQFAWNMLQAARRGYTAGFTVRIQSPADVQSGQSTPWAAILLADPGSSSNRQPAQAPV